MLRRLVGRIDAGEVLERAAVRLGVEALGIAAPAFRDRRVDEHLDELAVADEIADHAPFGAERRDERAQHDQSGVDEQLRHLADPADVLDAVGVGEAEIAVEAVAHVVAVEHVGVVAFAMQLGFDELGDGRLARCREAGEPDDAGALMLEARPRLLFDREVLGMDVGRTAQRERDHAGADRLVGVAVDDDEGAGLAVHLVRIEHHRHRGREIAQADLVDGEGAGRERLEVVDVELVLDRGHRRRHPAVADPHEIGPAGKQRLRAHPDHMRGELVGDLRPAVGRYQEVAARDVEVVGEGERDRIAGRRGLEVAVRGDDPRDPGGGAGVGEPDQIAAANAAAGDGAGEAAELLVRPAHPLHRKAERQRFERGIDLDRFQALAAAADRRTRPCCGSLRRHCRRGGPTSVSA